VRRRHRKIQFSENIPQAKQLVARADLSKAYDVSWANVLDGIGVPGNSEAFKV
jgi:hypothetical protein